MAFWRLLTPTTSSTNNARGLFRHVARRSVLHHERILVVGPQPIRLASFSSTAADCAPGGQNQNEQSIRIGHVQMELKTPALQDRHLIPTAAGYHAEQHSPTFLRHMQWIMAKDVLGQDMLLVGPPGAGAAYRRRLVLAYANLVQKPVEILTLASDLTESDLKQRRELVLTLTGSDDIAGSNARTTVEFRDQAPVRAAKQGRLLILDGLERAERNVLPTLNNLLENREMHLEDGTFLISPRRHEQLKAGGHQNNGMLIPVHKDFRVIALGVPTPPYPGRTLDPPIRSRFQIRRVDNPSAEELYQQLAQDEEHDGNGEMAQFCASWAGAMQEAASSRHSYDSNLFPSATVMPSMLQTMTNFPKQDKSTILLRAFPLAMTNDRIQSLLGVGTSTAVQESKNTFWNAFNALRKTKGQKAKKKEKETIPYIIKNVRRSDSLNPHIATVDFDSTSPVSINVPCGTDKSVNREMPNFVPTAGADQTILEMMQKHASGRDLLLLSPKGEGKNVLAQRFASLLGYNTHLFAMYNEMSSQDLLLRRATDPVTGQTAWEESPLLQAAKFGDICILDGVEKLRPDVLSTLQSLALDREIALPDGRRALPQTLVPGGVPEAQVLPIHPSFRIIALGSLKKDVGARWITPDLMSMFSSILLPDPSAECLMAILHKANPDCSPEVIDLLLELKNALTMSVAEECGVAPLSTRNLIRTVRRVGSEPSDLHTALSSILLADLLPPSQRALLESVLADSGIQTPNSRKQRTRTKAPEELLQMSVDATTVTVGNLEFERDTVSRPEMVPSPKSFFDIPSHVQMIGEMLQEFQNGERAVLLLGNQGVGKNMIVDRLCELARFEREYIQLHRDSTIGQLTLAPSLEDGKIVWNDSPLVRAVRAGCALVIDEADKAPVEVVSVLKGLVEDGELLLADGRRISKHNDGPGYIKVHPNFSLWVLANRPGFPFLGNDFFREIGDCFSTRVIQNPDLDSEIRLLRSYAPNLDTTTIRAIAASFSELRQLSDLGDISYPYSTREAVAVVKHLEAFPQDNVVIALHNVLDFDSFNEATYATLGKVFQAHGISVTDYPNWQEIVARAASNGEGDLRVEFFGKRDDEGVSQNPPKLDVPKHGKWDEKNEAHVGGNQWAGGTGGSNTAGLGGRGGPYRLDRGHKVHQVSDEAKAQVTEEAAKAAREMARKALQERLQEIKMSKDEWTMYQRFKGAIKEDISKLRSILDSTIAKSTERGWLKRQNHGEIDDSKLIDGVVGDKNIFKRRGNVDDAPSQKKKRLRFVMDCSGSMYRFNGYDERLIRCLEAALLVMESFEGLEARYDYSIVGHSGDTPCISLVNFGNPPKNENERMIVLQEMIAHSQFCESGDFTLAAMGKAIADVSSHSQSSPNDEDCIVIGVSDANLARYGIKPRELGRVLEAGEENHVKAFCIFIASFGEEAEEIKRSLPMGRGHVCMQTSDLPKIVREILTSNLSS